MMGKKLGPILAVLVFIVCSALSLRIVAAEQDSRDPSPDTNEPDSKKSSDDFHLAKRPKTSSTELAVPRTAILADIGETSPVNAGNMTQKGIKGSEVLSLTTSKELLPVERRERSELDQSSDTPLSWQWQVLHKAIVDHDIHTARTALAAWNALQALPGMYNEGLKITKEREAFLLKEALYAGHDDMISLLCEFGFIPNTEHVYLSSKLSLSVLQKTLAHAYSQTPMPGFVCATALGCVMRSALPSEERLEAVQLLLRYANIHNLRNITDDSNAQLMFELLLSSVKRNEMALVCWLLNNGLSPNSATGYSALFGAGNAEMVKLLLSRGAGIHGFDSAGNSVLHNSNMEREAVALLVAAGADVKARGAAEQCPLHVHASEPQIATLLLAHGAAVDARNAMGETPLLYAAKQIAATSAGVADQDVLERLRAVLVVFRTAGALMTASDENESTLLHLAVNHDFCKGVGVVAPFFDGDVNQPDDEGHSPLCRAALRENLDIACISSLLDIGADLDAKCADGQTPRQLIQNRDERLWICLVRSKTPKSANK